MDILEALRGDAEKLEHQLNSINRAIKALGGGRSQNSTNGRNKKRFSAASRAKMAASQKARWAKIKARKG